MTAAAFGPGTIDMLHQAATAATGLDDFGDRSYLEPLNVLVDAYASEADFTEVGDAFHFQSLVGALTARLFAQAGWARHPEHREVKVERPIFITGLARTGTTALNRLLVAPPENQGLELWVANMPQPRPPRETWEQRPDFQALDSMIKQTPYGQPEFAHIHFVAADAPEECDILSKQMLMGNMWVATANVPSYAKWLSAQDWTPALERHRANLQLISLADQDKRWVLKNPGHLHNLDELLAVYPDALVIWTHRDPRTTMPSICSLLEHLTPGMSDTHRGPSIGAGQLDYYATGVEKALAARARHDESQFLDVYYQDFVADPMGTVERIYDRLGETMSDAARTAVSAADQASHLANRKPSHRYQLSDFALTEGELDERFAGYLQAHPRVLETRD